MILHYRGTNYNPQIASGVYSADNRAFPHVRACSERERERTLHFRTLRGNNVDARVVPRRARGAVCVRVRAL